jgi:hypothetical protein
MREERARRDGHPDPAELLDFCAGRADSRLTRHVEGCPACAKYCDEQMRLWSLLDVWTVEPPAEVCDAHLLTRLQAAERPGLRSLLRGWLAGISWKPAIPAAALFAVWVAFTTPAPAPVPVHTVTTPAAQTVEAEQAASTLEDLEMLQQLKLQIG